MNSFDHLYDLHYRKIYRVALKISGNSDNASDIVQEVFISLFDNLRNGNQILYPGTWLYRTTVNKCCDYLRKQKKVAPAEWITEEETEEASIEAGEKITIIKQALMQLPDKERIIMTLYSEGLSYREISKASGIKLTSVGKTISRILDKMEKTLKRCGYEMY